VLRACGLGESGVGYQIKDLMKESKNPSVGTLASMGDIRIRITAKADTSEEASNLIQEMEREIRSRLGILIYGVDDETLHGNIARELERLNLTLSVVETFTGGIISQKLASTGIQSFVQGTVLASEASQRAFFSSSPEEFNSLRNNPKRFVEFLAEKSRNGVRANLGLVMFARIAEEQKKGEYRVETYYSLSTPSGIENQEHSIGGELWTVRERAAIMALDFLRKYLLQVAQTA
jgi:nicotinamide-nucleotide amidase